MFRIVPTCLRRNLSFNIFKKGKCEKDESTERIKPPQKYIIEKSCCKSIFETWKPKIPELSVRNCPGIKENLMMPLKSMACTPGMKFREKSRCEIDALAKECERVNHPKWITRCPPKQKQKADGPLPVLRAAMAQCKESREQVPVKPSVRAMRKECEPPIPEGDWNSDGHLG